MEHTVQQNFNGKVALITGGTSGIGRATAVAFAQAGAKVVVTGRREEQGRKTVELVQQAGGEGVFVRGDVTSEADIRRFVDTAVEKFGRLDCAFNNAGVESMGSISEVTVDEYRRVMDTNVLGVALSMKHEAAAMLKTGGGAIVNNASIAGTIAMPQIALYAASEHAVLGMTKAVALELARAGVRVNAVSPGAVVTEMYERFTGNDAETQKHFGNMHPVGRAGTPEEIALAVLYLCSPGASFTTGTNLIVDGGFTAN